MSLATRCPACATAFRVHADQLSVRGGRVRCGKCASVFDGVAQLVREEPPASASRESSPQLALFEGRSDSTPRASSAPLAPPVLALEQPEGQALADLQPEAPVPDAPPPVLPVVARPSVPPIPPWEEPEPRPRYRVLWGLLALLAALALAAQAAYRFRTELGVLVPQARPYLEAACDFVVCTVGLPRHPDLLSIESSDLQTDPQRDGVIVLRALLRNRAQFPQEYPALELTLTDEGERPVVRKVLRPADYLDARQSAQAAQGIGGGTEANVSVHFDASRVRATGYRLYLFYP